MIEADHSQISIRRQCDPLGLSRSSFYYEPGNESELNMILMRLLDEQYTKTPFYGIRRMTDGLNRQGYQVNHKKVQRLMRIMGFYAIYAKPRTTVSNKAAHCSTVGKRFEKSLYGLGKYETEARQ